MNTVNSYADKVDRYIHDSISNVHKTPYCYISVVAALAYAILAVAYAILDIRK